VSLFLSVITIAASTIEIPGCSIKILGILCS
jgi:hypothetical protein